MTKPMIGTRRKEKMGEVTISPFIKFLRHEMHEQHCDDEGSSLLIILCTLSGATCSVMRQSHRDSNSEV